MTLQIMTGDCIELMRTLPDNSVDSIVTDPPYGLGFMGKAWDALPPGLEWAEECLRVLKPGGHLLAFGGSRTWHRLAVAVEDAGFELRDSIAWLYGSGFPKSMDVGKAIDKAAGAEREVVGRTKTPFKVDAAARRGTSLQGSVNGDFSKQVDEDGYRYTEHTEPATDAAKQWEGWGTALKPAFEPVVMGRKPFKGTVAANVLAHGTGALNIDASRIPTEDKLGGGHSSPGQQMSDGWHRPWMDDPEAVEANAARSRASVARSESLGRFPANVILDEHTAALLDEQSGITKGGGGRDRRSKSRKVFGAGWTGEEPPRGGYTDSGGASRFFYCAKAPKSERPVVDGVAHPTVKPLSLMRYLITLVTPPGGVVLEPFAGSGTTVEAALMDGFGIIAMERDETYLPLIQARIDRYLATQMEDLI